MKAVEYPPQCWQGDCVVGNNSQKLPRSKTLWRENATCSTDKESIILRLQTFQHGWITYLTIQPGNKVITNHKVLKISSCTTLTFSCLMSARCHMTGLHNVRYRDTTRLYVQHDGHQLYSDTADHKEHFTAVIGKVCWTEKCKKFPITACCKGYLCCIVVAWSASTAEIC